MKYPKIIFLDVDGVLNGYNLELQKFIDLLPHHVKNFIREHFCTFRKSSFPVRRPQMLRLKKIVDATGARIVLSSSWRKLLDDPYFANVMHARMKKYGLSIYDRTGTDSKGWRENEIFSYLKNTAKKARYFGLDVSDDISLEQWAKLDPRSWIAIDDDYKDMQKTDGMGKLIRTEFFSRKYGLQHNHVKKAIAILNTN